MAGVSTGVSLLSVSYSFKTDLKIWLDGVNTSDSVLGLTPAVSSNITTTNTNQISAGTGSYLKSSFGNLRYDLSSAVTQNYVACCFWLRVSATNFTNSVDNIILNLAPSGGGYVFNSFVRQDSLTKFSLACFSNGTYFTNFDTDSWYMCYMVLNGFNDDATWYYRKVGDASFTQANTRTSSSVPAIRDKLYLADCQTNSPSSGLSFSMDSVGIWSNNTGVAYLDKEFLYNNGAGRNYTSLF